MLEDNMKDIAERYGKDLIVAEVSMGYTMEDYASYEKLSPEERKGYATRPALVEKIEYPMTVQGQCDFMDDFMNRVKNIPGGKGKGFYYWEPAWIPVPGSGWATPESLEYIQDKGVLVVGITDFAPMDYQENGEWVGFDADMSKIVADKLGVEIEFVEIDWDNKIFELDGKAIDVVWNGMTLTDAVMEAMECSNAYCNNAQVVVTK
jgi:hypothetical protein